MVESLQVSLDGVLNRITHPFYFMLILIGISFLVEDLAAATGVALASAGKMSWEESFLAVSFGIALGDFLLYGLGLLCRKQPYLKKRYIDTDKRFIPNTSNMNLFASVLISRVTPGLRLISYVFMGFVQISFKKFFIFVVTAVLLWTFSLYIGSVYLGKVIASTLGIPIGFATPIPLLILAIISFIFANKYSKRKCKCKLT